MEDMLAAIYHYAQRSELRCVNILPLIRGGNCSDLETKVQNESLHWR